MADWVCVPEGSIHPIPDSVDDLRAVFIEPLAAAFRILEQVVLEGGSRVAVVGDGKLGILCAWVLRLAGGEVHLFGKHALKMSMVGEGIATHRASECEGFAKSFAVVVEATGSPTGLPVAMRLVAACGTIVLKTTMASQHELDLAPLVIDEVRVLGSRCGPFGRAIEALERGEVDPTPLIGGIYPLERAAEAFEAAQQPGARKILLRV
jgi:threonine dehydrogenase-like Zn-dependent dehydrogenase